MMKLIASQTIGAGYGLTYVEFTAIPQTGIDLILRFSARQNANILNGDLAFRLNGVTTTVYNSQFYSGGSADNAYGYLNSNTTTMWESLQGDAGPSNGYQDGEFVFPAYTASTTKAFGGATAGATSTSTGLLAIGSFDMQSSGPITSIKIMAGGTLMSGSTFYLYHTKTA